MSAFVVDAAAIAAVWIVCHFAFAFFASPIDSHRHDIHVRVQKENIYIFEDCTRPYMSMCFASGV